MTIPFSSLVDQSRIDQWFTLQKKKSQESHTIKGEIHLVLQMTFRSKPPERCPFTLAFPNEVELHQSYRELLYKLIVLENNDLKDHEIQHLSEVSQALLDEFALRYGISVHYQMLTYTDIP